MRLGVIILARANFGRWPDKLLFELEGKTILEHVIIKSKMLDVDEVIVSTTDRFEDKIIREIAVDQNIGISLGTPDDRTARYCQAITDYKLDYFMSITPSAPFFDVEYTQRLIKAFRDNPGHDYYYIGDHTEYVSRIKKSVLAFNALNKPDRDQEIYVNYKDVKKPFQLYKWHSKELKNRYLFNANIAYRIQADNHKRICEYLGHFPENYDEVVKALMEIGL